MSPVITSTFLTSTIFMVNMVFRRPHIFWKYVVLFVLFYLGTFFFQANASEYKNEPSRNFYSDHYPIELVKATYWPNSQECIEEFYLYHGIECKLSTKDRKHYEEEMKMHKENAIRTHNNAKDCCWWLPNLTHRENARYCWNGILALISGGTPLSKCIAVVGMTLVQYGVDCCNQWEYIETQLRWSQYHYEMYEFYQLVLENG